MKLQSKLNHSFISYGCLRHAVLSDLYGFQEKRKHKARDTQILSI